MLQVSNVHKSFAGETLLDAVSFTMNRGDRFGLVGPNGCGKTTLLRIIVGQLPADVGAVRLGPGPVRAGYLAQALEYLPHATVDAMLQQAVAELLAVEQHLDELATAMSQASGETQALLLAEYGQAQDDFEQRGGYGVSARIDAVLAGLGLGSLDRATPVAILSGGQKTRLGLARLLLAQPDLLLLDEPTNHLDIEALEWLEQFLRHYPGAALVISHDRAFLDNVVSTILEIDPLTHRLRAFPGNYTAYLEARVREREKQWAAYKDQQEFIQRLESTMAQKERYARDIEHGTIDFAVRKVAMGIARRMVVQRKRLERLLVSEERIDKPSLSWQMKLDFGPAPESGREVVVLEEVAMGFGDVELFRDVSLILRAGDRIALVGANGSGKTTLARLITGELAPTRGRVRLGSNVRLGYFAQQQESLDPDSTPLATIRAVATMDETATRSFLHFFLFGGDSVFTPVRLLSFGERARLALARLVAQGCNFLLLDEPINHLDIPSRSRFEQALAAFEGTVLAIVHDRYFIEEFASGIWRVADGTVRRTEDLASW
jgi:ATPase subunit of ABC transporter with duplicated ATPase domains